MFIGSLRTPSEKLSLEFVDLEDPDNEDDDGQKTEKATPVVHAQQDLKPLVYSSSLKEQC